MRVVATAGHVDHGKSTLVRALTGTDPDRWAEEHQRGLTIDLGYAWTTLPPAGPGEAHPRPPAERGEAPGETVAFVDVPGHQRFIANMLAGLGPAPGVLFVVAADEGWRRQSEEHLAAVRALGIGHGVVAVTRSDLADPAATVAQVRERLAGTPLRGCEVITCSAVTGAGLDELRAALARLCAALPQPAPQARVRLWIDRVFTIRGAGTVVTGTLEQGTLRVGDAVQLHGGSHPLPLAGATVRGLQSLEQPHREVGAVARVAVNLRGVSTDQLSRGDCLLTPGSWHLTRHVDARVDVDAPELPEHLMAHLGSTAMQVRVRPLSERTVRLSWQHELPLQAGDRLVLRDPGQQHVLGGAQLLDVDPPELRRRGAGRRRGEQLEGSDARLDVATEVHRRGWARRDELTALGATDAELAAATGVHSCGDLLVAPDQWSAWAHALRRAVERAVDADPLQARMPLGAAAQAVALPRRELATALAEDAGLEVVAGHLQLPGRTASLGAAEAGLATIEQRLAANPFQAPEREHLDELGLGPRQVAAAVRLGRLIDLGELVVLQPIAAARAMRELAALPQPFTTSQARQALGTTRRVVIPLLEELDRRGWTRRIDAGHREVVRRSPSKEPS